MIILVGVPGCGKSSWAKEFIEGEMATLNDNPRYFNAVICSADEGHMVDGVYKFDPAKAPMAHAECLNKFIRAIVSKSVTHVIVDNTNISKWERMNYEQAAANVGANIVYQVWRCETIEQIKLCAGRNSHGVPVGVIADMALRFDTPDPHEIEERCGTGLWPLVYHKSIRE